MQQLFALGLVFLAFYGVVRGGSATLAAIFGSRYRAYRTLAAKYRGRCEARGLVDPPTVSFTHHDSLVRVGLAPVVAGQIAAPRTRVVIRFSEGLPLRLELFPLARPAPAQPPRGTRAVRLGMAEFDRVYLTQANDPDIAREVLAPESIRGAIDEMRRLCPPAGMLVSINPERLLIQVDRNLGGSVASLDMVVRSALLVHDWLRTSVARRLGEGIRVVEVGSSDVEALGAPLCEVCGDAIVGSHVVCDHCRTPCHRDCWTFVGACSTFGCSGKQCSPVAVAGH